jgi:putative heme iron utilization protein
VEQAAEPLREAARLIEAQRWLALGTVDPSGAPSTSYVPFAYAEGALAIVVSRLAAHTADLLGRGRASVLLVDDRPLSDAYTRTRFSIAVGPHPQAAGSAYAERIWAALEARHGATVAILQTLPDFEAISLEPLAGRLILGFASAHDIDAAAIAHVLRTLG